MGEALDDPGWRRGDIAAWWDPVVRGWRRGTLVARVTVPTFEYDVTTPEGTVVRVPARLLRSTADPAVTEPAPVAARTPPRRAGATLRERTG